MKQELPKPDVESIPSYAAETVCEMLFSDSNQRRAVITLDEQGYYRVHTDYWCLADYEYIGEGYWSQDDTHATITDTFANAMKMALEELKLKT